MALNSFVEHMPSTGFVLKQVAMASAKLASVMVVLTFQLEGGPSTRVLSNAFIFGNGTISVYCLGPMPIQSCWQSVSAPRGKAGVRLNALTDLRQSVSARRVERYTEIGLLGLGFGA